jgi:hypothetical protein
MMKGIYLYQILPSSSNKPLKNPSSSPNCPNDNPCTGLGISSILSNRLPPELRMKGIYLYQILGK